jgi:hypothetical protein
MAETDEPTSDSLASHTLAYLRRIEKRLEQMWEVLLRHDTRLGRIERDVNEVKSDQVLLENRVLTQTNEILTVVHRIDEHQQRLDQIDPPGS